MSVERLSSRYAALTLAYMAVLFWLSSLPGSATGPDTAGWRAASNASHVPLFAGLALCLALAFAAWPHRARAGWVLGIGAAYAALDEAHQAFVPGRTTSLGDLALDLAGVAAVAVAICLVRGRR